MAILKTKPIHSCHFTMAVNYHYLKDCKNSRWWWKEQKKGSKDDMLATMLKKLNVNEIPRQEWVGASCLLNKAILCHVLYRCMYSNISTYGVVLGSGNYDFANDQHNNYIICQGMLELAIWVFIFQDGN